MNFEARRAKVENKKSSEKEKQWQDLAAYFETVTDPLGHHLDVGTRETAVAFNAMDLPTASSCEGHVDHGVSAPWITIEAPNLPVIRFEGEESVYEEVAREHGVTVADIRNNPENYEIHNEVRLRLLEKPETGEFKKWRKENARLFRKAKTLLHAFYNKRKVEEGVRLDIYKRDDSSIEIHNGGEDYRPVPQNLSDEERAVLGGRLQTYQTEMRAFTEFLKQKFFVSKEI